MSDVGGKGRNRYKTGTESLPWGDEMRRDKNVEGAGTQIEAKDGEVIISGILTGIPIPTHGASVIRSKYPFADLPVEGSFFVQNVSLKSLSTACSNQNKKYKAEGRRFIARAFTQDGNAGVMVWRTA